MLLIFSILLCLCVLVEWKHGGKDDSNTDDSACVHSSKEDRDKAAKKHFDAIVRKAHTYLKQYVCYDHTLHVTEDTNIISGMFSAVWFRCITAISHCIQLTDSEIRHACLDGLAYCLAIATCLHLPVELNSCLAVLAKMTFIEKFKIHGKDNADEVRRRILAEEHMQQDYVKVNKLISAFHRPHIVCTY